jgi:transketolase
MRKKEETVETAVEVAQQQLKNIEKPLRIVSTDEIDQIIRQSFLYQTKSLDNRSEVTSAIEQIIESAIKKHTT